MCLVITNKEPPIEKLIVYKEVIVLKNPAGKDNKEYPTSVKLFSSFYKKEIKSGWYEAEGIVNAKPLICNKKVFIIGAGVIHCYTKKISNYLTLIACEAYPEDFIAWGIDFEIGYRKIWIPFSEIKRVFDATISS